MQQSNCYEYMIVIKMMKREKNLLTFSPWVYQSILSSIL
jgi:hypothetical protein